MGSFDTSTARIIEHPGSVATASAIFSGQPLANDEMGIGVDAYEFDGVGGNINVTIGGSAELTLDNWATAINASGTELVRADKIGTTDLRIQSASTPGGTKVGADPSIVLTDSATNIVWDVGAVNMNTLAGHAAGQALRDISELPITAPMISAGQVRMSVPFTAGDIQFTLRDASGAIKGKSNDTVIVDNGDVLITLSGTGTDPLVATDVVVVETSDT